MRGDPPQRPPALAERHQLFRRWPRRQVQRETRRLLKRKVAGRPGIGVTEAEKQEDVRRPRANPLDRDEGLVRGLRFRHRKRREIERAIHDGHGDCPQSPQLRGGEPAEFELRVLRGEQSCRLQRAETGLQSGKNGIGTCRRDLLRDDDRGQPLESGLTPSQGRGRALPQEGRHERGFAPRQRQDGGLERRLVRQHGNGRCDRKVQ